MAKLEGLAYERGLQRPLLLAKQRSAHPDGYRLSRPAHRFHMPVVMPNSFQHAVVSQLGRSVERLTGVEYTKGHYYPSEKRESRGNLLVRQLFHRCSFLNVLMGTPGGLVGTGHQSAREKVPQRSCFFSHFLGNPANSPER